MIAMWFVRILQISAFLIWLHFKYTIMTEEKTYEVKEYLRYRVHAGTEQMLLSWVGYKGQNWEPIQSLMLTKEDEPYMNVIREKYRQVCKKYQAKDLNVDNLEIINPNLTNANILQRKLDSKYMDPTTKSFNLGNDSYSSIFQEYDEEKSPCSKKEARKTVKKQQKIKDLRQQALENLKRIDRYVEEYQEQTLAKRKIRPPSINEQRNLPFLIRYDFEARFKEYTSDSQQRVEHLRDLMKTKMQDEPPIPVSSSQSSQELVFKLLHRSKIVCSFWREQKGRKVGYFQVAFQGINNNLTAIFHQDFLLQCCPSKVINLLNRN